MQSSVRSSTHITLALSVLAITILTGCLERTETIRINPNGSVDFHHRFTSERRAEFDDADAVPSIASGWAAEQRTTQTDDGKTKHELVATQSFEPGHPLPDILARPGDPDHELYLQFPTTLKVESRGSGQFFHFHRTYQPRTFAQVTGKTALIEERIEEITAADKSLDNPDAELSLTAQRQIAQLYVQSGVARLEAFARAAFIKTYPHATPDNWLTAHTALLDFQRNVDYSQLMQSIREFENAPDDELLKQLVADFENAVVQVIQSAFRDAPSLGNQSAFWVEFEKQRAAFEITEDLADDNFIIELQMPGRIVATNADQQRGNHLTWRFNGKQLRDAKIELLATSQITR